MEHWAESQGESCDLEEDPPEDGETGMESLISLDVSTSIQTRHGKSGIIHGDIYKEGIFHPVFQPLAKLFSYLGELLQFDPDFTRECFQRTIFRFVFEHKDEPFISCRTSNISRRVLEGSFVPPPTSRNMIFSGSISVSCPPTPDVWETRSQTMTLSTTEDEVGPPPPFFLCP